jgi:hypothetical protein
VDNQWKFNILAYSYVYLHYCRRSKRWELHGNFEDIFTQ